MSANAVLVLGSLFWNVISSLSSDVFFSQALCCYFNFSLTWGAAFAFQTLKVARVGQKCDVQWLQLLCHVHSIVENPHQRLHLLVSILCWEKSCPQCLFLLKLAANKRCRAFVSFFQDCSFLFFCFALPAGLLSGPSGSRPQHIVRPTVFLRRAEGFSSVAVLCVSVRQYKRSNKASLPTCNCASVWIGAPRKLVPFLLHLWKRRQLVSLCVLYITVWSGHWQVCSFSCFNL